MLTRIRRLPSPALVISSIALIAAIGGGSFAFANSDKQMKKVTKQTVKKISKKEIKKAAPGLSVDHATSADSATSATSADRATTADTATSAGTATSADSAQPMAFAHVSAAGVLDAANSKNAGAVTTSGPLLCFSGLPFVPRGGQATVDAVGSSNQSAQFGIGRNSNICPAGTQANVATVGGAAPVYVIFYN